MAVTNLPNATPGESRVTDIPNARAGQTPTAVPLSRDVLGRMAIQAAVQEGLNPRIFQALVTQESGWDPNIQSPVGATGLTQLMPATAQGLGVSKITDPVQNLRGGARYLKQQLDAFGGNYRLALAAYNAGPAAVRKYGSIPPYAETQHYVSTIMGNAKNYSAGPANQGGIPGSPTTPPGSSPGTTSMPTMQVNMGASGPALFNQFSPKLNLAGIGDVNAATRLLRMGGALSPSMISQRIDLGSSPLSISSLPSFGEKVTKTNKLPVSLGPGNAQNDTNQGPTIADHVSPFAPDVHIGRVDQGVDAIQSSPYKAPAAGTIVKIDPNWYKGTPNIYLKLDHPITIQGRTYPGMYFAETSLIPGMKVGDRIKAGQAIAGGSPPGSGLGEQGFAAPHPLLGWMQAAYGHYFEGEGTQ